MGLSRALAREESHDYTDSEDQGLPAPGEMGNQARLEALSLRACDPVPSRARFERALGVDLGSVRVVLGGEEAAAALDPLGANAAALGDTILFRDPDPPPALVGHELVHVVQQRGPAGPGGGDPEAEANELGEQAAKGEPVRIQASAGAGVPQFDARSGASSARDQVQDQRDKRGVDTPAVPGGTQRAQFVDHDDQSAVLSHDHGFLDDGHGNIDESKREEATWSDQLELLKWIAKLEMAEALRPDLVDGTAAYRHFLEGGGATRVVDYERFVQGDSSGMTVLASAMEDAQQAAMERHDAMIQGQAPSPGITTFRMRTDAIPVGNDGRYPYPATENWQKALGAHQLWLEMNVSVEVFELSRQDPPGVEPGSAPVCTPRGDTQILYGRRFHVDLVLHMEDRYNFNPGAADIATGTPDAANGRFEITGLGQEYLNSATLNRSLDFEASLDPVAPAGAQPGLPSADSGRTPRTEGRPDGARRANPALR